VMIDSAGQTFVLCKYRRLISTYGTSSFELRRRIEESHNLMNPRHRHALNSKFADCYVRTHIKCLKSPLPFDALQNQALRTRIAILTKRMLVDGKRLHA
jgi:hypothetical protein